MRPRGHRPSNRLENRVDMEFRLRKGLIVLAPGEARGRRESQARTRRCASGWACGPEAEGGSSPLASQDLPEAAWPDRMKRDRNLSAFFTRVSISILLLD